MSGVDCPGRADCDCDYDCDCDCDCDCGLMKERYGYAVVGGDRQVCCLRGYAKPVTSRQVLKRIVASEVIVVGKTIGKPSLWMCRT